MNDSAVLAAVTARTRTRYGLTIRPKRSSPLMWLIYAVSFMWIWNRKFMSAYATTIAGRCYGDGLGWRVIAHEGKHADQARGAEPWFSIAYLFPASLLPASIPLGIAVGLQLDLPWYIAAPIAFAFALLPAFPFPAPWRTEAEIEAYTVTAAMDALAFGQRHITGPAYLAFMAGNFGQSYWFPVWGGAKRMVIAKHIVLAALEGLDGVGDEYLLDMIATVRKATRGAA